MDLTKLDPQWVIGQGIAVFVCVILCSLLMLVVGWLLRIIVRELRVLQREMAAARQTQLETTGKLIGAIRWLGELIRDALNIAPPASPEEGFHAHRRKSDAAGRPAPRAAAPPPAAPGGAWKSTTPTPKAINPEDLGGEPTIPDPFE